MSRRTAEAQHFVTPHKCQPMTGCGFRAPSRETLRRKYHAAGGKSVMARSATMQSSARGSREGRRGSWDGGRRDSQPGSPPRDCASCRPAHPETSPTRNSGDPLPGRQDGSRIGPTSTPRRSPACRAGPRVRLFLACGLRGTPAVVAAPRDRIEIPVAVPGRSRPRRALPLRFRRQPVPAPSGPPVQSPEGSGSARPPRPPPPPRQGQSF